MLRRRDCLRWGAACLAAGPALAACSRGTGAGPGPAATATTLTASIGYQGGATYSGTQQELVESYIAQHFSASHPGVRVLTTAAPNSNGSPASSDTVIAAILAGQGADVLGGSGYQLASFLQQNLLAPLDGYVQQAGIDTSVFDQDHLAALTRSGRGLIGLPAFDGPDVVLVNWSVFDGLGLARPTADWTADAAAALWRQAAGTRSGSHMWGMGLDLHDYFARLFGGQLMNAAGTQCLLDQPAVLQAANWLVPQVQAGVVQPIGTDALVTEGEAACGMGGGRNVQTDLLAMQALHVEWDWLPMPVFPAGRRFTYNNSDWYGLNSASKNPPELAWELLQFIALDPGFAHLMYSTTFVPPNQVALWDDWMQVVRGAAPQLASKQLQYFAQAMDYGVCDQDFANQPYQCDTILQQWFTLIFTGSVDPGSGLRQCAAQINALQAPGAPAGTSSASAPTGPSAPSAAASSP